MNLKIMYLTLLSLLYIQCAHFHLVTSNLIALALLEVPISTSTDEILAILPYCLVSDMPPFHDIQCLISKTDTSVYSTSVQNTEAQNRGLFLQWLGCDFSSIPKLPHVNSIQGEMQVSVWVSHSFSKPIPRESFYCIY